MTTEHDVQPEDVEMDPPRYEAPPDDVPEVADGVVPEGEED